MWKNVVAPTLLVILFWGLSSIATAYYIRWLEAVPERMILEDLATIHAADLMRYKAGRLIRVVLECEHPANSQTMAQIAQLEAEFRTHLEEAVQTATTPQEIKIDRRIESRFEDFCREVDRQVRQPTEEENVREDVRSLMGIAGDISTMGIELAQLNEKLMKNLAIARSSRSLTFIRHGLLIIGPAAGILCGFWISRGFHRSISQISISLNDVESEMSEQLGRVEVHGSGELPRLAQQVNAVVARIREVMQELNEARRQAISAARLAAVGEMAAGVAHELRNPLTSVKLLVQRSAQRPQRSMTDKQISVVLEEIARMESTIERMLDFARPPRMNRARQDIREILRQVLGLLEVRAHESNTAIVDEMPPQPVHVHCDAEQLHEVFSNLAQNAIEAMPNGGTLRATIQTVESEYICRVILADTGAGIVPEVMRRIFEPFVTDKARGTGLGLAVSHRIVKDHGGSLVARNSVQGGAVLTVELPLINPLVVPVNSVAQNDKSFSPVYH